jgi:hypothetical protein
MINATNKTIRKESLARHGASSGMTPFSVSCICEKKSDEMSYLVFLLVCTHLIVVPENSMVEAMEMEQVSSLLVVGDHVLYEH